MSKLILGLQESIAQYQIWIDESLDMGILVMLYQHLHFLQFFLDWISL
jgi:hypothetical protein